MKLLREPFFHFLLAGAGLFVAYTWLDDGVETRSQASSVREIRVGEGELRWVSETWTRQWQRTPSPEELRGLVANLLKEELLAREARELGLDKDDTVVRRRLAQKMTFLIEDTARISEPDESDLRQFYDAHKDNFRRTGRVSFVHVFFDRSKRVNAATDAQQTLVRLAADGGPEQITNEGDRLLIEAEIGGADLNTVTARFGQDFAREIFSLPPGAWSGPIESAYGLHLVRVSEMIPGEVSPFAQVKVQVLEQWHEQQRRAYEERYFAELFKKYDIVADERVEALVGPLTVAKDGTR
ncbi:hypothetical protein N181_30210 [Sinorhizobium fredii USDA 205]|uniref:Parvulin-like PPIase n=1 Tax=Rhizobium fredii TaxID=380 RepID=A0A844AFE2_RHIFR|nr:peptidylprolyl isomerase [Sinorhizobium fredii]ASY71572.1 hypothetical protein SF83666_b49230 [Sinorhizobium fredii CCBAU 83666]AWM29380.1 hypothetical protein AOX55_00006605 [Sinorhizobium fredii CCBAU 25509]KSV92057.1 hypothetical protein N181_30210 [Sinorhizobium fredii USDA 205]MQX11914.1 peptidyl-prolyl cis-trans isomerase [Sinorhizobium fredii]GEC35525.1 hypothetical protein EFR01_56960 [Sinorhizobium fredii]